MRRIVLLSAAILAAACASTPPKKPAAEVTPIIGAERTRGAILYAWTQIVASKAVARAVVEGSGQPCPEIVLDELPAVKMTSRPGYKYPITVCEHPLELAARAQVADRLLPIPGNAPERIAVMGPHIEESVAKTIARRQMPTLVVYMGDVLDGPWDELKRGFFEPAGELLQVAPWMMAGEKPADAYVRLYRCFLQEVGEDQGYLMLASKGSDTWDATLSSPKGDETRSCRLGEAGFDCGFPKCPEP